jgi:hypothetical protein
MATAGFYEPLPMVPLAGLLYGSVKFLKLAWLTSSFLFVV